MTDDNPRETFTYAARQLNRFHLAYLRVRIAAKAFFSPYA
jgi:hypothetical protein